MELLNLIERVLHRDAISILKPTAFSLLEGDPSAACQEVKVTVNGPCIVCRVERRISLGGIMTEIHPYLNDVVGVKKMCDYIIFYKHYETDNNLYVFLCELKGKASYRQQLKAGYSFARFIIDAARRHGQMNNQTCDENIKYLGAVFTNSQFTKHALDPSRREILIVDPSSKRHIEYSEIECKRVRNSFELNKFAY